MYISGARFAVAFIVRIAQCFIDKLLFLEHFLDYLIAHGSSILMDVKCVNAI